MVHWRFVQFDDNFMHNVKLRIMYKMILSIACPQKNLVHLYMYIYTEVSKWILVLLARAP
jgi:hypothetical protein